MERIVMMVMHPRERVWDSICERTCELAPYLEHIEHAQLLSRETADSGLVRCVHAWRARGNLPALLAPHVDKGLLAWTGRTEWFVDAYESRWVVEPVSMKGAALCEGMMRFSPAVGGRGTRVDLDLELSGTPASLGMRTLTSSILSTHFRKLVDAAARSLAPQP